jgi:hypothetical protein
LGNENVTGAGRHKVHSSRQDNAKKAVRIGDMDADMRGNVATFENEMGGLPRAMEAG